MLDRAVDLSAPRTDSLGFETDETLPTLQLHVPFFKDDHPYHTWKLTSTREARRRVSFSSHPHQTCEKQDTTSFTQTEEKKIPPPSPTHVVVLSHTPEGAWSCSRFSRFCFFLPRLKSLGKERPSRAARRIKPALATVHHLICTKGLQKTGSISTTLLPSPRLRHRYGVVSAWPTRSLPPLRYRRRHPFHRLGLPQPMVSPAPTARRPSPAPALSPWLAHRPWFRRRRELGGSKPLHPAPAPPLAPAARPCGRSSACRCPSAPTRPRSVRPIRNGVSVNPPGRGVGRDEEGPHRR